MAHSKPNFSICELDALEIVLGRILSLCCSSAHTVGLELQWKGESRTVQKEGGRSGEDGEKGCV